MISDEPESQATAEVTYRYSGRHIIFFWSQISQEKRVEAPSAAKMDSTTDIIPVMKENLEDSELKFEIEDSDVRNLSTWYNEVK